jgi:short-subunit dehydrogenase
MKLDDCSALITGASAGLGREFARQLAPRARALVLVARRGDRLNELRDELAPDAVAEDAVLGPRSASATTVQVRVVDLCDQTQIDELVKWLEQEKIDIDLLINNAGLGDVGPFASSEPPRNREMLLVNIVALTALTRKLLPRMIAQKRGAILNVSSSAGFLPIPTFAVYAATKAYVNSFTEALRAELRGTGITVTALCPGPVRTEFQSVAQRPGGEPEYGPDFVHVSPERVVRDALAAVEADRPLIIPGVMMRIGMCLVRLTPMSILRLAWRLSPKR